MLLKDFFPFSGLSLVVLAGKIHSGLQPLNDKLSHFRFTMTCEREDQTVEVTFKPKAALARRMKRMLPGTPVLVRGHLDHGVHGIYVCASWFEILAPMDPFSRKPVVMDDRWKKAVRMASGLEKITESSVV